MGTFLTLFNHKQSIIIQSTVGIIIIAVLLLDNFTWVKPMLSLITTVLGLKIFVPLALIILCAFEILLAPKARKY